jgi:hypothetical protein
MKIYAELHNVIIKSNVELNEEILMWVQTVVESA